FDDDIPYWEDWDFLYRLSKKYHFTGVQERLARTHTDADERLSDAPDMAKQGGEYLIAKHAPIKYEEERFPTRKFKGRIWYGIGHSALMNDRYREARNYFIKSIREWPFDPESYLYCGLSLGGEPLVKVAQVTKRTIVQQS
ncbi:MAG: tol-pal system YbgF family protein, partial [Halobacteriaceae archaeon]